MRLGSKNWGLSFSRARWGQPACIVAYGWRDPCAGPGNIPWRLYRCFEIRSPVRVRLLRMWVSASEAVPYAAEITTGWRHKRRVRIWAFPSWVTSALWWLTAS